MAFSLNYAFITIILVFGIFGVLFSSMSSDFFVNQAEYNLVYQADPIIKEQFSALDLTLYQSYGNDTMLLTWHDELQAIAYTSIFDTTDPLPPQWETAINDRFLEVKWSYENIGGLGGFGLHLDFRDTRKNEFLGFEWYSNVEYLRVYYEGQDLGVNLFRATIANNFGTKNNVTLNVRGSYLSANIILSANTSKTLIEGWDDELLYYSINYEIDFDAMKPDAWNLIGQLVTFQNPDFGLPEELEVITYSFSLAIWVIVAIIAYTIITKLIPTISGGIES